MLPQALLRTVALPLALLVMPVSGIPAADLAALVNRPYLELAEMAPTLAWSRQELDAFRKDLDRQRQSEAERLKKEEQQLDRQIEERRKQLQSLNKEASTDTPKTAEIRHNLHCDILRLEKQRAEKRVERQHGLGVTFDNKLAKVDLLERWPAIKRDIDRTIAAGRARQRPFGDVEDIGVREISKDQEKDIKLGEEALRELKTQGLMPPELEDKAVKDYVQTIADRIAANSDVKVPVKLTVLRSQEINAFALPGGYLFVNTALMERAGTESELAGVIAHELAHVSARHGAKLMKRANIASIMYQVAQIAVMIGTGGFASIGAYYLFQAGFLGLGLVLDLSLLGVSREFEAQADQLGAQYAWKSGYDPRGFITFFDKMATEKGYVQSASFFRTHPPYFERIVSTLSEIAYLPAARDLAVDSSGFQEFKRKLADALREESKRDKDLPTLRREPKCDSAENNLKNGESSDGG
jgi:Zn-dependent protease with chaperone function